MRRLRRTTTLAAAGVLGLAVLGPTTAATAAETCRGEAATIVGSGHNVTGTEGPDVIVSNGATSVRGMGGDDLICISGSRSPSVRVYAGDGNDVVDGTGSPKQAVFAQLGSGADSFLGGGADDRVTLDYPDISPGPDLVQGGGGTDELELQTGPGAAVVDNSAGRFTSAGQALTTWSGLEQFWLDNAPAPRDLTFVGSDADELVVDFAFTSGRVDIDLGGGDDSWLSGVTPVATSRVHGGAGVDLVHVASVTGRLDLDLEHDRLEVTTPTLYRIPVTDVEDARLFAPQVVLAGDDGDNRLGVTACEGVVRGRKGDDVVKRHYDSMFETDLDCGESLSINGGPGNDVLRGSSGDDDIQGAGGRDRLRGGWGADRLAGGDGVDHLFGQADVDRLLGGSGRDVADGGQGRRDTCAAERERRCER